TANVVGELISYTMAVTNKGNAAISNVQVSDPFVTNEAPVLINGFNKGDIDHDNKLDVNETWQYTASHAVTQAELNAGGNIVNVAKVTGDGATPDTDDACIAVVQNKAILHIEKDACVPGDTANVVGELISYTMAVTNKGNAAISNVQVSDPFVTNEAPVLINGFNKGDQAELDAGGKIVNTATVTGDGATPDTDNASVVVAQCPSIDINKVTVYEGQKGDGLTSVVAGHSIGWEYTVTNTGNVSLSNVNVKDNNGTSTTADDFSAIAVLDSHAHNVGDVNGDGKLNPGEHWQFSASGIAVAGNYSNIGTASGKIGTTTVTDSDSSSYCGTSSKDVAQIAPTGTTVQQYINGTSQDFSDHYASQSGVVQYGVKSGLINNTNPGAFFYYTGLSNAIKGVDANHDNKADAITVFIDQSDNSRIIGAFNTTKHDIKLFKVTDLDHNGIDAGDTVTQVQLNNNQITRGTHGHFGDVTINFTPDAVDSLYVISVKYDTNTVVDAGLQGTLPTVKYTFTTDVGKDGTIEETDSKGITLAPKNNHLMLDGDVVQGDHVPVLKEAVLQHVVDQAIDFWAQHGADTVDLSMLRETQVQIADLGGKQLGLTDAANVVTIDDDAAGHGWWTDGQGEINLQMVDLLSAVTHEFGHVLGYDHDLPTVNPVELVGVQPHQVVDFA
ncbi:MAG: hypothetical protein LUQ18_09330, partial [Methylococcaceae bacterium]|nr:hypothetical protein [Methylococcaceae bacterium]